MPSALLQVHRVPKTVTPLTSNAPNSVCSSWISTTYHTLQYHNITYGNSCYDICILLCVQHNIMTSEFIYIKVTFNTLLLTEGLSSSVLA